MMLTRTRDECIVRYKMRRRQVETGGMTAALRRAIAESGLPFLTIERGSGVVRQSLMKFARGERFLRLDSADLLAKFFSIKVIAPKKFKCRKRQVTRGKHRAR
jgi:hypothetical protein